MSHIIFLNLQNDVLTLLLLAIIMWEFSLSCILLDASFPARMPAGCQINV